MTEVANRSEKDLPQRFRPYPKYRDSGVEWLGPVPSHWDVKRTKFAATLRSGHTPSRQNPEYWKDCTIPWFGLADVWQIRDGKVEYVHVTAEKISETGLANSAARLLPRNTVILSRTASVGFSAILGVAMATTQDFVNWICGPSVRPEYLLFVFRSMDHEFQRLTMGSTHQTIYMPDVACFSTVVPPRPEQEQIVACIRNETAKIDALVEQKQRLIKLLQEKRTALITRAVTQGLDPNVPMKESGVEWLGAIPGHWKLAPLRRVCASIATGGTPQRDYLDQEGTAAVDWFTPGDFTGDLVLRDSARRLAQEVVSQGKVRLFPAGSVCVVGIGATLGRVGLIEEPAYANQQINVVTPSGDIESPFLAHALSILGEAMTATANRATLPILNQRQMGELVVPIPPLLEQKMITSAIAREAKWIEDLRTATMRTVVLLNEYRIALISAAVTGRVDVRGASFP